MYYLEPANITNTIGMCGVNAWAQQGNFRYQYLNGSEVNYGCQVLQNVSGYDMQGGDLSDFIIAQGTPDPVDVCAQVYEDIY